MPLDTLATALATGHPYMSTLLLLLLEFYLLLAEKELLGQLEHR